MPETAKEAFCNNAVDAVVLNDENAGSALRGRRGSDSCRGSALHADPVHGQLWRRGRHRSYRRDARFAGRMPWLPSRHMLRRRLNIDVDPERCASRCVRRGDPDAPAHETHDALADGQPEARTAEAARCRRVRLCKHDLLGHKASQSGNPASMAHLRKWCEEPLRNVGGDAAAVVFDLEAQGHGGRGVSNGALPPQKPHSRKPGTAGAAGELDRIRCEV